jgi:serine/threonine-protein kinase RIO1
MDKWGLGLRFHANRFGAMGLGKPIIFENFILLVNRILELGGYRYPMLADVQARLDQVGLDFHVWTEQGR